MIARYSKPEMAKIWDDRSRYQVWLRVELAVCQELAREGLIPRKDWAELSSKTERLLRKGGVDPARVEEIENVTRHDVIAFTTAVAEAIGPSARYIHFGLTSSDVIDTSLSLMLKQAGNLLCESVESLLESLKKQALRYESLATIGRSHGMFAEPTSFGLKFLSWYTEWVRNHERLVRAIESVSYGKLSGAVGVNAHWDPDFEERVLVRLGLNREPVSTQVIPRDRHAEFVAALALCGGTLERMAVELRHLQRSEVGEVLEPFRKGQKGSSAMPHKRNPISSENLTGCARLLRSYCQASLENTALWHERDISHSSVERITLPDATILLHYALSRMNSVIEGLVVRKEYVKRNLEAAGSTVYSGHFLLELVRAGASREESYAWVQECALASLEGKGDLVKLLAAHPEIKSRIPASKLKALGSSQHQLRNVKSIYRKALQLAPKKVAKLKR